MSPELQIRIARVLGKYDREYQEYRKTVHDPERLRFLDEAHLLFLHDQATDREEAHEKGIVIGVDRGKSERNIEIARNMKRRGCDVDFIIEMTGLTFAEIGRLG